MVDLFLLFFELLNSFNQLQRTAFTEHNGLLLSSVPVMSMDGILRNRDKLNFTSHCMKDLGYPFKVFFFCNTALTGKKNNLT